MLFQNAAKGWNSLCHWRSILWAAELGTYYSNVYGKISFAPLNILSSVLLHVSIHPLRPVPREIMCAELGHSKAHQGENEHFIFVLLITVCILSISPAFFSFYSFSYLFCDKLCHLKTYQGE